MADWPVMVLGPVGMPKPGLAPLAHVLTNNWVESTLLSKAVQLDEAETIVCKSLSCWFAPFVVSRR